MAQLAWINAQLPQETLSNISLKLEPRQEPFGIILIIVRISLLFFDMNRIIDVPIATQYCDGLRGAMVVYDPNDPNLDR